MSILGILLNRSAGLTVPRPIRENERLKRKFVELIKAGVDPTALSFFLYVLGVLDPESRNCKRNRWPDVAMTEGQLKRLPQRIRTMAAEMQRLNTAPLFDPKQWVPTSDSPDNGEFLKFLAGMHSRLSGFLDTYAAYLDWRLAELGYFGKTKFSLARDLRKRLSEIVFQATGNYYDEKLADLISAVTRKVTTGDALKKLRKRNPRRRKRR